MEELETGCLPQKNRTILGVIEAYDTIERLQAEITDLKYELRARDAGIAKGSEQAEGREACKFESMFLAIGQKKVYEDSVYSWSSKKVKAVRDEDSGKVNVTSFKSWRREYVNDVPLYMSAEDFYDYFDEMLRTDYERQKQEALDALMKEESDD